MFERFTRDLAQAAVREGLWGAAEAMADAAVPGSGRALKAQRTVGHLYRIARGLDSDAGPDLTVPVACTPGNGFVLGVRAAPFEAGTGPLPRPAGPAPAALPAGPAPFDDPWPPPLRRGVWPVPGGPEGTFIVVAPRCQVRLATGSPAVDAQAVTRYLDLAVGTGGDRAPQPSGSPDTGDRAGSAAAYRTMDGPARAVAFVDPDLNCGLLVVEPAGGDPYCPALLQIAAEDAGEPLRLWLADPGAGRSSPTAAGADQAKADQAGAGAGADQAWADQAGADAAGGRGDEPLPTPRDWPAMLDELIDRFDRPPPLLVRAAIAAAVATPMALDAFRGFPEHPSTALRRLGAHGTAFLLDRAAPLIPDGRDGRAVRLALQELIVHDLSGGSIQAAECRSHLGYLLANRRLLDQAGEAARRDLDRGPGSRLRRLTRSAGGPQSPEDLLEFVLEQVNWFSAFSRSLDLMLTDVVEDLLEA